MRFYKPLYQLSGQPTKSSYLLHCHHRCIERVSQEQDGFLLLAFPVSTPTFVVGSGYVCKVKNTQLTQLTLWCCEVHDGNKCHLFIVIYLYTCQICIKYVTDPAFHIFRYIMSACVCVFIRQHGRLLNQRRHRLCS